MIDGISMIHMMEKEKAAEAARRFCFHFFIMHIMLIPSIMLIALSSTIWISMTYAKFTALDAWGTSAAYDGCRNRIFC